MDTLGALIRRHRKRFYPSMHAAAKTAGISRESWRRLESDTAHPESDTLLKVARALLLDDDQRAELLTLGGYDPTDPMLLLGSVGRTAPTFGVDDEIIFVGSDGTPHHVQISDYQALSGGYVVITGRPVTDTDITPQPDLTATAEQQTEDRAWLQAEINTYLDEHGPHEAARRSQVSRTVWWRLSNGEYRKSPYETLRAIAGALGADENRVIRAVRGRVAETKTTAKSGKSNKNRRR